MSRKSVAKTQDASPDYPLLAQKLIEASEAKGQSKLPCGLYIVATPIGHLGDITLRALMTLQSADMIACEDTRVSGLMLSRYGIHKPLIAYHDHNADKAGDHLLAALAEGKAIALISDAGMPLISDPGYRLVKASHEATYNVTVIPGANAAITALAGSGLPTDQFFFAGFLPAKTSARRKALSALNDIPGTLIFYEAPQRLADTLQDMAETLGADRPAVMARELTKMFEEIKSGSLANLAATYATQTVKGEIVILVNPADDGPKIPVHDLDQLLRDALRSQSVRDAVAEISNMTGLRKADVYARALKISEQET